MQDYIGYMKARGYAPVSIQTYSLMKCQSSQRKQYFGLWKRKPGQLTMILMITIGLATYSSPVPPRVFAWYKTDAGLRVENGVSLPVNARIEMQVTLAEILQYEHHVEGILAHEMIHYIHHMRVMNTKGWMTIWPGDGHNYMAYLKYVKGYDLPANKY